MPVDEQVKRALSSFMRLYIKTGIFDKSCSALINAQYEYRTSSDYDDFFIISKKEVVEQVDNAKRFLTMVKSFLSGKDVL